MTTALLTKRHFLESNHSGFKTTVDLKKGVFNLVEIACHVVQKT
jgi:hypothetical protein